MGAAMAAFAANPKDEKAAAEIATDPVVQRHAAHDLCGDPAVGRPCQQCAAPACRRQYQLPHFSRHHAAAGADTLAEVVGDPEIKITLADHRSEVLKGPQPLNPKVIGPGRDN